MRRSQSLEETDLRDLLEQREHSLMITIATEEVEESMVVGGGANRRALFYASPRTRTKSSGTCDQRKGPADAAKIPVLPLHQPGLPRFPLNLLLVIVVVYTPTSLPPSL